MNQNSKKQAKIKYHPSIQLKSALAKKIKIIAFFIGQFLIYAMVLFIKVMQNRYHGHYQATLIQSTLSLETHPTKIVQSMDGSLITSLTLSQNHFKTFTRMWMGCWMSGPTSGEWLLDISRVIPVWLAMN